MSDVHELRVAAVARESGAIGVALRAGAVTAEVPSCPGWTLAQLARHAGEFCGFWSHVLCEGTGREKTPFPGPPDGDELVPWFEQQARHLARLTAEIPADQPVWTWNDDDQTAGFIARRAAHELAVHRYDAQLARSAPEPIDRELAADGIDEVVMIVQTLDRVGRGDGETLHLHGTDGDEPLEWLFTLAPEGLEVRREHAKGDVALRGSVSDLELALYGRPPVGSVEVFGDESVLKTWRRIFRF